MISISFTSDSTSIRSVSMSDRVRPCVNSIASLAASKICCRPVLDEHVYVALGTEILAEHGAEEGQSPDVVLPAEGR